MVSKRLFDERCQRIADLLRDGKERTAQEISEETKIPLGYCFQVLRYTYNGMEDHYFSRRYSKQDQRRVLWSRAKNNYPTAAQILGEVDVA